MSQTAPLETPAPDPSPRRATAGRDVDVVVPVFNEAAALEQSIRRLHRFPEEVRAHEREADILHRIEQLRIADLMDRDARVGPSRRKRRQRDIRTLQRFDDRMLADIGLGRSKIECACHRLPAAELRDPLSSTASPRCKAA